MSSSREAQVLDTTCSGLGADRVDRIRQSDFVDGVLDRLGVAGASSLASRSLGERV